jgi:hypothetical protein
MFTLVILWINDFNSVWVKLNDILHNTYTIFDSNGWMDNSFGFSVYVYSESRVWGSNPGNCTEMLRDWGGWPSLKGGLVTKETVSVLKQNEENVNAKVNVLRV